MVRLAKSKANRPLLGPPSPLKQAAAAVQPFLNGLSRDHVYITHMDAHPAGFKKQIFIVPVLLNLLFLALLAWRAYHAIPSYIALLYTLWNLNQVAMQEFYSSGLYHILRNEVRHCITVLIDYGLVVFVAPWPYSFFIEKPGNPTSWRTQIGFQQREMIVRISRSWTVGDILYGVSRGENSPFWKVRVLPAVQMDKISKTGYLLMDKNWDLDFHAMTVGQHKIGKDYKEEDINGKLWCFWKATAESPDNEGYWVMWDFRREFYTVGRSNASSAESGDAEQGKWMMIKFQDNLAEMGKEDLFFRWVELIQYESSQPGGFTTERQIECGRQVKELFDQYGVDFEAFEQDVGIKDGRLAS